MALKNISWIGLAVAAAACPAVAQTAIAPHPEKLTYPQLDYKLPPASEFRATLSNGMVVFISEDRLLPTFDLGVTVRVGAAVDPPGKSGLASLTAEQMRDGGTESLTPSELDERIEFLAANINSNAGDTSGRAGLSLLSKDIDEGLKLLVDVLRKPRFDEERLRLAKERRMQNIKRRFDESESIEDIEWSFLLDGEDHFSNQYPSSTSITSITRDDLVTFHKRYYHPGNFILAVSGDFDKAALLAKLEEAFKDWPIGETGPTTFPAPTTPPKPGVYVVQKEGVNQGRISLGHKGTMRGSPDEFALRVMNGILGASGFRSRLVAKVRSDEGLAYSVGSMMDQGTYYPGDFRCFFQSDTIKCAYATKLVLDEVNRIRTEKVEQKDVDDTVNFIVESFPQRFQNRQALMETYANDAYTGRDSNYWQTYVANVKAVTPDDVQRVAQKYLHPDSLIILAVGAADQLIAGGHDKAPDLKFDAFGPVTKWVARDPDTMKR